MIESVENQLFYIWMKLFKILTEMNSLELRLIQNFLRELVFPAVVEIKVSF